jgi:hypothetical protein
MDCKQFRASLNSYVDGELSSAASTSAHAHRQTCLACDRAARRLLEMKAAVKRAVSETVLPVALEDRVRAAITPRWTKLWQALPRTGWGRSALAGAAVILTLFLSGTTRTPVEINAANAMDRLALRLDDTSPIVLEGTLLCRDCELEHRYGVKASCRVIGHHGAIATADGRIWNLVEQRASADLIHDSTLLGKRLVVRGRLFRGARTLVIESYQFQS